MTSELKRETPLEPVDGILTEKMVTLLIESYGIRSFGSLADHLAENPDGLKEVLRIQDRILMKMHQTFAAKGLFAESPTRKRRRKLGVITEPSDKVVGFDGNLVSREKYERQLRERHTYEDN